MHPVGPLSSRVYWIRRAGLIVVAVLVLIGMVWFLANRDSSSARQQSDATLLGQSGSAVPTLTGELAASSVSALPSVLPSASASASASPSASADASPSPSPAEPSASSSAPAASPSPSASVEATAASGSIGAAPPASPTDPAPSPTPEPTAPAAPPPSYDPQGRLLCPDADIAVAASTSEPSFATGQQPRLTLSITNKGAQPCVRDLSGPLQIFTVFAADGTRVWSTADCFPGQGSDVRELAAGQAVAFTIKWAGTSSAPGCTGDRAPVPAGDYTVVAQLGALSSPPVALAITG